MTLTDDLVARMLAFDANAVFDGYPTMTCSDEGLIDSACTEAEDANAVVVMACVASDVIETREDYENAKRFYDEYCRVVWECNMVEGGNPVFEAISEEEEPTTLVRRFASTVKAVLRGITRDGKEMP